MNSTEANVALGDAPNAAAPAEADLASTSLLAPLRDLAGLGLAPPPDPELDTPPPAAEEGTSRPRSEQATSEWRRIALEKQLPQPRFPAGVRVPSIVVALGLVLLAAACVVFLGGYQSQGVEAATIDSQRRLTADLARETNASAAYAAATVGEVVNRLGDAPDPVALLNAIEGATPRWRGGAVMDEVTQTAVAATGEPVPVAAVPRPLDGQLSFPAVGTGALPRLVIAQSLPGERLLVVAVGLAIRPLYLDARVPQTILVTVGPDRIGYNQGTGLYNAAVVDAVRSAVTTADGRRIASVTGETVAARRTAIVATAAPVGALGLEVVSVIEAPLLVGTSAWSGIIAAGTLLGVTALAVLVIWIGLVRPVRRLRQSAAAAASGQVVARAGKPRSAEVRRIAAALDTGGGDVRSRGDRTSGVRRRGDRREGRRGVPAAWCVVAATLAVLAWSGGVFVALSRTSPDIPAHVGVDTQNRVVGVATSLSDMLHNGLTQLTQFAGKQAAAGTGARPGPLADLLDEGRFRSVYLLDAGRLVARVGREPLRGATAVPPGSGVHLDESVERVPAVYAYTRLPDGRTLVAEFDVQALISLLRRLDGRALVVDDRMRTILDTEGYIAFNQPAGPVRQAAALALRAPSRTADAPIDGADGILAYAAVSVPAAAVPAAAVPPAAVHPVAVPAAAVPTAESGLRWAVVSQRRASDHRLAVNDWRTHVWLVVLLGVCLGGLLLGWHHLVLLRPLRVLAAAADRLASGDTKSVVSPSRHDEIGAIAVCLDVCRQARAHGPVRLGGAPRMRGTATDQTVVLPRILFNFEGP